MSKKIIYLILVVALLLPLGASVATAAPLEQEMVYTVVLGDNLWNLADKYHGNGAAYRSILWATHAKYVEDPTFALIKDRSLIHPGWKLSIPDKAEAEELLAKPIKVYFVPSAVVENIITGGEVMRKALVEATGLEFEVFVPTSYAAFIEGMCASPGDTMGFPATLAYVVANARCGVDASMISVRYGWDVYWAQFIVARDSDIQSLADLDGKKWAYTDATSTSGFMFPLFILDGAGIEVAEKFAAGGHTQSVLAVYNGEADFGTTYFSAALVPEGEAAWQPGDDPEPYKDIVDECAISEDGKALWCGGYRILDARAAARETAPDVVQEVRIVALSDSIPNDCLAFGPDFPPALRAYIEEAFLAFKETPAWDESIGSKDFYSWSDVKPITDAKYDVVRVLIEAAGYSMDQIVGFMEE